MPRLLRVIYPSMTWRWQGGFRELFYRNPAFPSLSALSAGGLRGGFLSIGHFFFNNPRNIIPKFLNELQILPLKHHPYLWLCP